MKIQHTPGKGRPAPKGRGGAPFARLVASVGLFLLAFGGKELLPQVSQPVFHAVENVMETNLDLNGIALQVGAFLQGEGDGAAVFREVLGVPVEGDAVNPAVSPHGLAELAWLGGETDTTSEMAHYLPRWEEREVPGWLP